MFYQSIDNGTNWTNQSFRARDASANWVEKSGLKSLQLIALGEDVQNAALRINTPISTEKEDAVLTQKLTVGPNPNNGNFWFFVTGVDKEVMATLYTIHGKVLKRFKLANLQRQQVNGLRSGMYILKVEGLPSFKIIVQADTSPSK